MDLDLRRSVDAAAAQEQEAHVRNDQRIEDERRQLDRRVAARELVDLDRNVDAAAQCRDPLAPAALEPQAIGLREANNRISHGEGGEGPQLSVGKVVREVEEDARE